MPSQHSSIEAASDRVQCGLPHPSSIAPSHHKLEPCGHLGSRASECTRHVIDHNILFFGPSVSTLSLYGEVKERRGRGGDRYIWRSTDIVRAQLLRSDRLLRSQKSLMRSRWTAVRCPPRGSSARPRRRRPLDDTRRAGDCGYYWGGEVTGNITATDTFLTSNDDDDEVYTPMRSFCSVSGPSGALR